MSNPIFAETNDKGNRWYVLPTGERLISVTTVLSYVAKLGLIDWAAGLAADAALDRGDDVAAAQWADPCHDKDGCGRCRPCLRIWLGNRHLAVRDEAGDRGSRLHEAAEHLSLFGTGGHIDADIQPYFDAYRDWFDRVKPEIIMSEATVFSRKWKYAGTLDAIMKIPADADLPKTMQHLRGMRLVVDYKSGKSVDRIAAWQMAAYRHAETVLLPDGTEEPMPEVDGGLILHIRPDGVQMREAFVGPKAFNQFANILRTAEGMTAPLGESLSRPARLGKKESKKLW